MKYLGIDWGEKRIGLALGDDETKIASPFKVVATLEGVLEAAREEEVGAIIVGRPMGLEGHAPTSEKFADFLGKLKGQAGVTVEMIDERFSSKAADALEGGKKTKAERDALAAMVILQDYLNSR